MVPAPPPGTGEPLNNLVTDDPKVPNSDAETEMEWTLLQSRPGGRANEVENEKEAGAIERFMILGS